MGSCCQVSWVLRNHEKREGKEKSRLLTTRDFTVRGIDTKKLYDPFEALLVAADVASRVLEEEEEERLKKKEKKKVAVGNGVDRFMNVGCFKRSPVGLGFGSDAFKQERLIGESSLKNPMNASFDEFDKKEICGLKRKHVEINGVAAASKEQISNSGNKKSNIKNPKKQKIMIPDHQDPPPPIPEELRDFIVNHLKGSNPVLVIQKSIFETDANRGHNRLSMPLQQIIDINVFTPEERLLLEKQVKLPILFVEPSLQICDNMGLRRWNMSKGIYALITEWNKFRERSGIKKGDIVQVWLFRVEGDDRIGLTVVKVSKSGNDSGDVATSSQSRD